MIRWILLSLSQEKCHDLIFEHIKNENIIKTVSVLSVYIT